MKPAFFVILGVMFAGCANAPSISMFERNYQVAQFSSTPYSGVTQLLPSEDPIKVAETMKKSGAVLIGQSSYQSEAVPDLALLQDLAKKVGADSVVYGSYLIGSQTRMTPVYETVAAPQSTTQTTNVTVNTGVVGSQPVLPTFDPGTTSPKTVTVVRQVQSEVKSYQWQAFFFRNSK